MTEGWVFDPKTIIYNEMLAKLAQRGASICSLPSDIINLGRHTYKWSCWGQLWEAWEWSLQRGIQTQETGNKWVQINSSEFLDSTLPEASPTSERLESRYSCVCIKMKVSQSCPTLCDPMDNSLPGPCAHGTLKTRILEWVAIPFFKGSSWPRDWTWVSCTAGRFFTIWATRKLCMFVCVCVCIYIFAKLSWVFWLKERFYLLNLLLSLCTWRNLGSKSISNWIKSTLLRGYTERLQTQVCPTPKSLPSSLLS